MKRLIHILTCRQPDVALRGSSGPMSRWPRTGTAGESDDAGRGARRDDLLLSGAAVAAFSRVPRPGRSAGDGPRSRIAYDPETAPRIIAEGQDTTRRRALSRPMAGRRRLWTARRSTTEAIWQRGTTATRACRANPHGGGARRGLLGDPRGRGPLAPPCYGCTGQRAAPAWELPRFCRSRHAGRGRMGRAATRCPASRRKIGGPLSEQQLAVLDAYLACGLCRRAVEFGRLRQSGRPNCC